MRYVLGALAIAAAVSGCQSKPISEMSYTERKELVGQIIERCSAQGYPPGHPEATACHEQEALKEANTRIANTERRQRFGAAMAATGAQMQANANANRMRTTNCSAYGNSVSCQSF